MCHAPVVFSVKADFSGDKVRFLVEAIRILRSSEGVDLVVFDKLDDYRDDEHGKLLIIVDRVMRTVSSEFV